MHYRSAMERLRHRDNVPLFVGEVWDSHLRDALKRVEMDALFAGAQILDAQHAAATLAGLHLWNDDFNSSHNLCQGISVPTGAYWHGLCHRREGHQGSGLASNLNNARHWFRQVETHPLFPAVSHAALGVLDEVAELLPWAAQAADALRGKHHWDPSLFIDWVEASEHGHLPHQAVQVLKEIQWREIDLLVDWCAVQALGL